MNLLKHLPAPDHSFASDNCATVHPDVLTAICAANTGSAAAYGDDPHTTHLTERFQTLFNRDITVALCATGTGANVVALHTLCDRDSIIICTADAHLILDEAGAPEHITGAQLWGYPWTDGKLTVNDIDDAASRMQRTHIRAAADTRHVVAITNATEVGTVYTPDELAALCNRAHYHGYATMLDGARLANAFANWQHHHHISSLADGFALLADCGLDVIVAGGTKAGLLGAEAVVFCDPADADAVLHRRKQATQTVSKQRYVAAQFHAALDNDNLLRWAAHANNSAQQLADELCQIDGITLGYPCDSNAVFVHVPDSVIGTLTDWTPFYVWDPATQLIRFVCSHDTTRNDINRLIVGIRAAAS
jgi:threonine aldolase